MTYPIWVREPVLEMYRQGLSSHQIEALIGISHQTVSGWFRKAGIVRSKSESHRGNRLSLETRQKLSDANKGELHPQWKGDNVGYHAQHKRAMNDFPDPLGPCQIPDCETPAVDRARIDHTNLPYRKEYVLPMCHSCNVKHDLRGFVILFQKDVN